MIIFQRAVYIFTILFSISGCTNKIPKEFIDPPREFSVMPFWFWNDTLKEEEIIRQIADFEDHGVYGFVIHPRIGLPENITWLSAAMIEAMNIAIREAARRKMYVILYDEGMYPSGSSSGQVVARNPSHAARGLARIDLKPGEKPLIAPGEKLISITDRSAGKRVAIIDRPSGGVIRGLHYIGEGTDQLVEQTPPAGDILNPDAVTSFMELVYDRYAKEFGDYFGTTILGIFTDEPSTLGRNSVPGVIPGNIKLLDNISKIIGYDIIPFLSDLWYNDTPDSEKHRNDYNRAINISLEENYYKRLGNWCREHGIALMGHPAGSMDIGAEQFFQVPGQDLVWRYVEPGPKALGGQHSTMAKCASSAMIHLGLRRNSNELYGAYGHDLTFDEMNWLANWCFLRGQNMLFPHAFYYSVRGPRLDERPPDVGPNAKWWDSYKPYADACRRLSWINSDSRHMCDVAILCDADCLPDKSAKTLYQNQHDFNYLELRHLIKDCRIDEEGVHIAGMTYKLLIIDTLSYLPDEAKPFLEKIAENGQLLINKESGLAELFPEVETYGQTGELISEIKKITGSDLVINPASTAIRSRHVMKGDDHYYFIFNEDEKEEVISVKIPFKGNFKWLDPYTGKATDMSPEAEIKIKPHELKIFYTTRISLNI